jgi:SAM-dependent methyltransferase
MRGYEVGTYGDRIAEIYDGEYASVNPAMIDRLAELAGDGRALELGIGTGRIALPLQARGVEVHGLDASVEMVAKLREKPGGDRIRVTMGDFEHVAVEGRFSLVYVVFNTFFGLLSQEAQVSCFRNVAKVLEPGGRFALELFVPDVRRFTLGQNTNTNVVASDYVDLTVTRHDAVKQTSTSQHVRITEAGIRLYPVVVRYAWPSELDLMALLAGMMLESRSDGWEGRPFTAETQNHVSVYRLGDGG